MNFNELIQALAGFEQPGNTFLMPTQSGADWIDVDAALGNLAWDATANANALAMTGVSAPVIAADTVTYVGQGTLFDWRGETGQQAALTVSAVFSLSGGKVEMQVTATPAASGWCLSQSFGTLNPGPLQAVAFASPVLILVSMTGRDPSTGMTLSPGINFAATPTATGALATIGPFLPDLASMSMTGLITQQVTSAGGNPPVFQLTAPGLAQVQIGTVALTAGLEFSSSWQQVNDDPVYYNQFVRCELTASVAIGSGALPVRANLVPTAGNLYQISGGPASIPISSLNDLSSMTGGLLPPIPPAVPAQSNFSVRGMSLSIALQNNIPSLKTVSFDVGFDIAGGGWALLPAGILTITDLGVKFSAQLGGSQNAAQGTLYGTFTLGDTLSLDVTLGLPSLLTTVALTDGTTLPLSDILEQFVQQLLGPTFTPPIPNMEVTAFELSANPREGHYALQGTLALGWSVDLGTLPDGQSLFHFELTEVGTELAYSGGNMAMAITGWFTINSVALFAKAATAGGDTPWVLTAGTDQGSSIPVLSLVADFIDPTRTLSQSLNLDTLGITDVEVSVTIAEGNTPIAYRVKGATNDAWTFTLFDIPFQFSAAMDISGVRNPPTSAGAWANSGRLDGALAIDNLKIAVGYAFTPDNSTLTFSVLWRNRGITAVLGKRANRKQPSQMDTVLTFTFGDLTLGEMIEALVNLADPDSGFALSSPWDVLNQINFRNLSVEVNLTDWQVQLQYAVNRNFVFVEVGSLFLTYRNDNGKPSVVLGLSGKFLDQPFGGDDPLEWDLLNDPAPTVPAKGPKLIDIRFVGLGQRLALTENPMSLDSVEAVINAMSAAMNPAAGGGANPLNNPGIAMRYDANSRWLVGLDMTLLDTVSLSAVFYDPYIYGLLIKLSGDRAGSLAGLRFELIYKKVTDDIGVFKIDLRIPDQFRQLEFGAVSVTLAIVHVDIYTNGDFLVDLGFPKNGDFSVSFSVQVFPFIGYGGFYFAKLNGQTSDRVPRVSNGVFSPVIEAGLGLSVGLGKTFNKGPLKAGLSVSVYAILEGTLGWFTPYDPAVPKATYYWIQGMAGVIGKLYGEVDFYVIKVSVSVTLTASVTVTFEAYQPTEVLLEVTVSVRASIKILFIRIHFSFDLDVKESFTIGHASTPPWTIATTPAPQIHAFALRANHSQHTLRPMSRWSVAAKQPLFKTALTPPVIAWTPVKLWPTQRALELLLAPAFSVAPPNTLFGGGTGDTPATQAMLLLSIANTSSPQLSGHQGVKTVTHAHLTGLADGDDAPFTLLARTLLYWALASANGGVVPATATLPALEALHADLDDPETETNDFVYSKLSEFLGMNLKVTITGTTPETVQAATSATPFPIVPDLSMALPGGLPKPFSSVNEVPESYVTNLAYYVKQMLTDASSNNAETVSAGGVSGMQGRVKVRGLADGDTAIPAVIFSDYFIMVARSVIQAAIDALTAYPYSFGADDSLDGIAAAFPPLTVSVPVRQGETLAHVARRFGVPLAHVESLNAEADDDDDTYTAPVGLSALSIASANPDAPLNTAKSLTISKGLYQIGNGATLTSIAAALDNEFSPAAAITDTTLPNAENRALLLTGASLSVPGFTYTWQTGDSLAFLAAFLLVRNQGAAAIPAQSDYSQIITQLPANAAINFAAPLTVGSAVAVPTSPLATSTANYLVRAQDSLAWISGYFAVTQAASPLPAFTSLQQALQAANPGVNFSTLQPGASVNIPAMTHAVGASDLYDVGNASYGTTDSFASLTLTFPGLTLNALATANVATAILSPLAVLALPTLNHTPKAGETIRSLCERYDMALADMMPSIETVQGLLVENTALVLPDVTQIDPDDLIGTLLSSGALNSVASQTARFLLHGLRLPDPSGDFASLTPQQVLEGDYTGKLYGLYDLCGARVTPPVQATPYELTFTSAVDWVGFAASSLALDVNPASYSSNYTLPSLTFDLAFTRNPAPLPLWSEKKERIGFSVATHWQAAVAPAYGGVATPTGAAMPGQPTLWAFTDRLVAIAQSGTIATPTLPYDLIASPHDGVTPVGTATPIASFDWATQVTLNLKRVPAPSGQAGAYLADTYLVLGSNQAGMDAMAGIIDRLTNHAAQETGTQVTLLYAASADNDNPGGFCSDATDAGGTLVLKTNLSTETHAPQGGFTALMELSATVNAAPPASGQYYSTLADPLAFLTLIWEASITGTGGFYLVYRTQGGNALPVGIFDADGLAILNLVVILGSQCQASSPQRGLFPFNNIAVVGDNFDATRADLFAECTDANGPKVRSAIVPPGNYGFSMQRANPEATDPQGTSPTALTQSLFSLAGFAIQPATGFDASNAGLPAGPTPPDGDTSNLAPWDYSPVLYAAPRADSHPLPVSSALPSPEDDPYAGIASGNAIQLALTFSDVFGNVTPPSSAVVMPPIPVGYTDDLIGPSQWPGLTTAYWATGIPATPTLAFSMAFQFDAAVAGENAPWVQSAATARAWYLRYRQIYFQIHQADVYSQFRTSLDCESGQTPEDPATPIAHDLAVESLYDFANGAVIFLRAATTLIPVVHTVISGDQLLAVAEAYSSAAGDLLSVNREMPVTGVFAAAPNVPQYVQTQAGDTVQALVTRAGAASAPAFFALVGPDGIANQDAVVAAKTGIGVPAYNQTVPAADPLTPDVSASLRAMAAQVKCALGDIVNANAQVAGLLAPYRLWTVGDVSVTVAPGDTFAALPGKFATQGLTLTAEQIAAANQDLLGVFATTAADGKSQTFSVANYVTTAALPLSQFAKINPAWTVNALLGVAANLTLADLFVAGQKLFASESATAPLAGETLEMFRDRQGITFDQFAGANSTAALTVGAILGLPDLTQAPSAAVTPPLAIPLGVIGGQSLKVLAANLATTSLALATLNQDFAGLLVGNIPVTVTVDGKPYTETTIAGQSLSEFLASYPAAANVQLADLVTAIESNTSILRQGAVIAGPLPVTGSNPTFASLASAVNATPGTLARANATLDGFLKSGQTVTFAGATAATGPHMSLTRLVVLLRESPTLTIAPDLVDLTSVATALSTTTGLIESGVAYLAPPPPVEIQVGLAASPVFPDTLFPITANLSLARLDTLALDGFKQTASVYSADMDLPPRATLGEPGDPMTLRDFAAAFEKTWPKLKCASRKTGDTTRTPQLFAVNFGAGAAANTRIGKVGITSAQPSFFALPPLANHLMARSGVSIYPYTSGQGLADTPTPTDFQGIDMDGWASQFLAAVDLILSPANAGPLYLWPGLGTQPAAQPAAAYEALVGAKATLSSAIAGDLTNILASGSGYYPGTASDAQTALKNQLQIALSAAYSLNAVIQFPTDIQASYRHADLGTRLEGRPEAGAYLVPDSGAGFDDIASLYGVTAESVADLLATTPRILHVNLQVSVAGKPDYTITQADTLQTVAYHFALPVTSLPAMMTPTTGLFASGARISIDGLSRTTLASDTLESLASAFDVSVYRFGLANGDLTPFLVSTATVEFLVDGKPISVAVASLATNSLNGLYAAVLQLLSAEEQAQFSFADMMGLLRSTAGLVAAGNTVKVLRFVADFTIPATKLSLANGAGTVNFPLTVKETRSYRNVPLKLNYVVNEIEMGIQPDPDVAGYESSAWGSFLIPLDLTPSLDGIVDTHLDPIQVPLPLRAYPVVPVLGGAAGAATAPAATTIATAKQWTYSFLMDTDNAAQDTTSLTVSFNEAPSGGFGALFVAQDLFDALAEFASVYPSLKQDLALLTSPGIVNGTQVVDQARLTRAQVAISVFQNIATQVASLWASWRDVGSTRKASLTSPGALQVQYQATTTVLRDTVNVNGQTVEVSWLDTYVLRTIGTNANHLYPDISYVDAAGAAHLLAKEVSAQGDEATYRYDQRTVPAFTAIRQLWSYPGLDVVAYQNARAGAQLARNLELLSGAATAELFVYRTTWNWLPVPLTPYVVNDMPIDLALLGNTPNAALTALFTALLDTPPLADTLRVAVRYGYPLAGSGDDALIATLPAVFKPSFTYLASTTVHDLVSAVSAWAAGHPIDPVNGRFIFDVAVFSSLDTSLIRPLVELRGLHYPASGWQA